MPKARADSAALVRLTGVHKHYRSGTYAVQALHDIHLQVEQGEMLAICGPSGHGKTTLLNLVGLLDTASAGEVEVDGNRVGGLSEAQRAMLRASTIGLVFQSFSLVPVLTAQDNVLLPLQLRARLKPAERTAAAELAAELLARLGLASHLRHYPARLDAGQCQRVAIARALVTRPRLVVADEPTSRLDSGFVRTVGELFASYQREHGTTFVISTRDQRQLARATRTLQLADGRLQAAPVDAARRPLRMYQ